MSAFSLLDRQALDDRAARALTRMAPVRKHYQHALGLACRGTVARHYSGEWPSEATRSLRFIDTLARSFGTSPWPLIGEHIVVAIQGDIRLQGTMALQNRLAELTDRIPVLFANAERTERNGHPEDKAVADMALADALYERAAIRRELERPERRA